MIKEIFLSAANLVATEVNAPTWSTNSLPTNSVIYSSAFREDSLIELSRIDIKSIDYRVEFQEVILPRFLANRQRLASLMPDGELDDIQSIQKYYLFWRFAQDAHDVKWYVLMLQQAHESTFSKNPIAFFLDFFISSTG